MNPRIYVGAAVAAIAAIVGVVALSGQGLTSLMPDEADTARDLPVIEPLVVELELLEVSRPDADSAVIDLKFKISNPNQRSVILQLVKYELFEDGIRIHAGQIGDRFAGFVEGSDFYPILAGSYTTLSDSITVRNTGDAPEFWDALDKNTVIWHVQGDGFFNLSSITAGNEHNFTFEASL